jgi:peptidoglycan/LPS O-acetylase OafA/YrhL
MWLIGLALLAQGVWLAVDFPGTFAYWMSPLLAICFLALVVLQFLTPWDQLELRRKALAWTLAALSGAAGGALVIADPGRRSYLLALMLLMPLFAVLVAWQDGDRDRERGEPVVDPTWDLPDF